MAAWQTVSWGEYGIYLIGMTVVGVGALVVAVVSMFRK